MPPALTFLCDCDDVVCDLMTRWLEISRDLYDDDLHVEDLDRWDIHEQSKAGYKIYDILNIPGLYEDVKPHEGALEGVTALREMGHRVVFVTSTNFHQNGAKFLWLVKHGFLTNDHNSSPDYIEARDKRLVRGDVMIDDHIKNLDGFLGHKILMCRPHNRNLRGKYNDAHSWQEVVEIVADIQRENEEQKNKSVDFLSQIYQPYLAREAKEAVI